MQAINPTLIIAGPAIIAYKGKGFYSKESIPVTPTETLSDINSSAYGSVAKIATDQLFQIKLTPLGNLDSLDVLYPRHLRTFAIGKLLHYDTAFTIATVTGIVTATANDFDDGHEVRVATLGTLPAGLSASTLYYYHKLTADTGTLHTTLADALAGTSPVIPTTTGTGTLKMIEQPSLQIWSINESKGYKFHNAVVSTMPSIGAKSTDTALKEVAFTALRKHGADPETDSEAFFSAITVAPSVTFDPDAIVVTPYTLGWGAASPWSAVSTEAGIEIDFGLTTEPVRDDVGGILSYRVTAVTPTAKAKPLNISEDAVLAKRLFQGTGARHGRKISDNDDLVITGDGLCVVLYNAALTDTPINYDGKANRSGDFTWSAQRKFTAGVPQALFYIGTEAPV